MSRKGGLALWWKSRNLNSLKGEERLQAVEKLSLLGSEEAVPLLIQTLTDSLSAIRTATAAALGELQDDRAIRPLVDLLVHERVPEVRQYTVAALSQLDREKTKTTLLSALDDHDVSVTQTAAWALQKIALDSLTDAQRAQVAVIQCDWEQVAKLGSPAVPALCESLLAGTDRTRRDAVEALAQIGSSEACSAVVSTLRDIGADAGARETAAWALRQYVWPGLEDADLALAAIVLGEWDAIETLGVSAAGSLGSAMHDPNTQVRERAAKALGRLACDEAVDALTLALGDAHQDVTVRTIAAQSLGTIPGDRQLHALADALDANAWPIRRAAASSLSRTSWEPKNDTERALFAIAKKDWDVVASLGTAAATPLEGVLKYHAVSGDAARALIRLGQPGVDVMVATLKDTNADMALREVASTVVAELGDRRAIEPLHEMLAGPDIAIRHSAIWALERLGWEAETDNDRVLVAIARDEWTKVRNFGTTAVRPLLYMLSMSLAVDEAAAVLNHIIETMAGRVDEAVLREMVNLPDRLTSSQHEPVAASPPHPGRYDTIRRFAKNELSRRGVLN